MRVAGLPVGMWALFAGSLRSKLTYELDYGRSAAREITKKAHGKYRELIGKLPDFEKSDRFSDEYRQLRHARGFRAEHAEEAGRR